MPAAEELARALMDSCHLRTLAAAGNVLTAAEAGLKEQLESITQRIERELVVKLTVAQAPLLARLHAAHARLQRYAAVLVGRLQVGVAWG
jgi:hypothetical protein